MSDTLTPVTTVIHKIATTPGIAGQSRIHVHATVTVDPDVDGIGTVTDSIETFVGNDYGTPGPVVWFYGDQQVYVTDPARFGDRFNEDWVRAFFAPNACGSPAGYVDSTEYCPSCERDNREGHYENCAR